MPQFEKLEMTGLERKFGQLTREDKKIKLINKENNEYLHFVKK